jgi:hypothetical protein
MAQMTQTQILFCEICAICGCGDQFLEPQCAAPSPPLFGAFINTPLQRLSLPITSALPDKLCSLCHPHQSLPTPPDGLPPRFAVSTTPDETSHPRHGADQLAMRPPPLQWRAKLSLKQLNPDIALGICTAEATWGCDLFCA